MFCRLTLWYLPSYRYNAVSKVGADIYSEAYYVTCGCAHACKHRSHCHCHIRMHGTTSPTALLDVYHPLPGGCRASHSLDAAASAARQQGSPSRTACADLWPLMMCPTCSHASVCRGVYATASPARLQRQRSTPLPPPLSLMSPHDRSTCVRTYACHKQVV